MLCLGVSVKWVGARGEEQGARVEGEKDVKEDVERIALLTTLDKRNRACQVPVAVPVPVQLAD